MVPLLRVKFLALYAVGLLLISSAGYADLRIVVDVSRPMDEADPNNLRGTAIEYLSRNLGREQRGGLWSYSKLTQQLVSYGPVDPLWQQLVAIHGRNLNLGSGQANPTLALESATWDMNSVDRGVAHVVWLSNGHFDTGLTELEHLNLQQILLNTWAAKLKGGRIRVHAIALNSNPTSQVQVNENLLRQVAGLSGGFYKQVTNKQELQNVLQDIMRLVRVVPEAKADAKGRFQVAPGATELNALWHHDPKRALEPVLIQPDGTKITRSTNLVSGRWLLAADFEMVSITQPQVGWWTLQGAPPARLGIFGEVEVRVSGIDAPVIPSEESHAKIQLFSKGSLVTNPDFLALMDLRVWAINKKGRLPLAIVQVDSEYEAYFVNLDDGAYELEVVLTAPTFKRRVKLPFIVENPLRVDVVEKQGQVSAWLTFNHADVDYASLKASAKVRKPPAIGRIVPAAQMPGGLFQIPIEEQEGVVEMTFNINGNYLNKKGFFMKAQRQSVVLPLTEMVTFRFDANGKRLNVPMNEDSETDTSNTGVHNPGNLNNQGQVVSATGVVLANPGPQTEVVAPVEIVEKESTLPPIPLWFIGIISALNLLIGGAVWWLNRPKNIEFELLKRPEEASAT